MLAVDMGCLFLKTKKHNVSIILNVTYILGYVPRRPFIFGGTYRSECDDCVDEFLGTKGEKTAEKERLEAVVKSYPKLHPITRPELVVKKLNHLKDHKEGAPAIAGQLPNLFKFNPKHANPKCHTYPEDIFSQSV